MPLKSKVPTRLSKLEEGGTITKKVWCPELRKVVLRGLCSGVAKSPFRVSQHKPPRRRSKIKDVLRPHVSGDRVPIVVATNAVGEGGRMSDGEARDEGGHRAVHALRRGRHADRGAHGGETEHEGSVVRVLSLSFARAAAVLCHYGLWSALRIPTSFPHVPEHACLYHVYNRRMREVGSTSRST